ncbi:uncharacterized protein LOC101852249 [Aplysia californica]|uniref:Uncharacterized protein LOC101852249 n=1 Tax=Aplysia californica TaxID=6500 RepID=A0ABM0JRT8_APLCA|nr:uncharacterized protein LOC101852249 [Aplysia californica]
MMNKLPTIMDPAANAVYCSVNLAFKICFSISLLMSGLSATETVTEDLSLSTTTVNTTTGDMGDDKSTANTAGVVAASVIAVLACIIVVVIVFVIKRRRQSRMMDKEKKMQIQMSSARNAGVYQDLTVSVPVDEKPPASPEHERLQSAEDA